MQRGDALSNIESVEVESTSAGALEKLQHLIGLAFTPAVSCLGGAAGRINVPREKLEKVGLKRLARCQDRRLDFIG